MVEEKDKARRWETRSFRDILQQFLHRDQWFLNRGQWFMRIWRAHDPQAVLAAHVFPTGDKHQPPLCYSRFSFSEGKKLWYSREGDHPEVTGNCRKSVKKVETWGSSADTSETILFSLFACSHYHRSVTQAVSPCSNTSNHKTHTTSLLIQVRNPPLHIIQSCVYFALKYSFSLSTVLSPYLDRGPPHPVMYSCSTC